MKISIIGGGNMGSALCMGFVHKKITAPKKIIVADQSLEKLKALQKLGVWTSTNNQKVLESDILILAVKPQGFADLAKEISGKIPENTMVLSIMAGVKIKKIQQLLKHKKVARAMPNTPALVGAGVTGWYAGKEVNKAEKTVLQKILQSTGHAYLLATEEQIDDFMTVSSCGTGFFYHLLVSWLKASEEFKLPKKDLKNILIQTLTGSLDLLESSSDSLEDLIQKVASKGGATEAGLKVLDDAKLENVFAKMMKAAYNRSKQLG